MCERNKKYIGVVVPLSPASSSRLAYGIRTETGMEFSDWLRRLLLYYSVNFDQSQSSNPFIHKMSMVTLVPKKNTLHHVVCLQGYGHETKRNWAQWESLQIMNWVLYR